MELTEAQLEKLIEVFSIILDLEVACISNELAADALDSWDSLALVSIVSAIENEFGVKVSNEEALSIETFGDAKKLLELKL